MNERIGYLIPEFPGQTHAFFMRERGCLADLQVDAELISTRPPVNGKAQHDWATAAAAQTSYLAPMNVRTLLSAVGELLRCGPAGWLRSAVCIAATGDLPFKDRLKLLAFLPAAARLRQLARGQGWKHIHVHSCANAANVAMLASRLGGIQYSMTLHGPLKDYGPNQKAKWQHADFGIIITQDLLAEAREQLAGHLPSRLFLAPMGVEVDRFQRDREYRPASRSDVVRLVSCGRINPCKGHDDLIRAVAELKSRDIIAELHICGATDSTKVDYRDSLLELAKTLDVADQVRLLGSVSEADVRNELQDAHFFCLGSHKEPLGVATMEAMAMELPCIVTSSPGVTEMITDGIDGILVPPKTPVAFADAIERQLDQPFETRQLATQARTTVCQRFHSGVSAEAIRDGVAGRTPVTAAQTARAASVKEPV